SNAANGGGTASSASSVRSNSNPNIVGMHYKVGKKVGEGSFGIVYEGVNMLNNQPVAIKFEPRKTDAPQLRDEYRTFKILANSVGVPNVYFFGQEGLYNILCIDLLGPSLEDMFDLCKRKFSVKTVYHTSANIHERNMIYRDIKPDNFLIGRLPRNSELVANIGKSSDPYGVVANHSILEPHPAAQIHIIDFGMAKMYRDPKTKQHIPYREKKSLSGTARHVFMYFLRGALPWQGMKAATNKQKYEKIGEKKRTTPLRELCDGYPDEFAMYLQYCRDLKFEETPDYDYLRGLFTNVLVRMGEHDDGVFDWMIAMDSQRRERERQLQQNMLSTPSISSHTPISSGPLRPGESLNRNTTPKEAPRVSVQRSQTTRPIQAAVVDQQHRFSVPGFLKSSGKSQHENQGRKSFGVFGQRTTTPIPMQAESTEDKENKDKCFR
ncbi:kinase-like protein, partial [Rhizoclosmatium globosum]